MCGFSGYLGGRFSSGVEGAKAQLLRMNNAIAHRGPDSDGYWVDPEAGIALGHRRLAVVELSAAGAQPMRSADGRFCLAFNGEIYNHLALRAELERSGAAPTWRGHSDTETLLAGFDAWGVQRMVERCIGMFAFALWDRQSRALTLGRDRLGEKPLYYGWQGRGDGEVFLFGSDLSALRAHADFSAEVDRGALCGLLRHNYIGAPHSIYQNIHKLAPGTLLSISLEQRQAQVTSYWSAALAATAGNAQPFAGSAEQATDALEALLMDAIGQQMMADVPLGAFLSGGIDSSTVVALMQAQASRPVKTFTIGFNEQGYNEAVHAKAVAQHLGTDHTELYVTAQQALDVIPKLPRLYSEPFADSSQIPTYLVSAIARQQVTVALSGDAGDELFCGYHRYAMVDQFWKKMSALPLPLRQAAARSIVALPAPAWNRVLAPLQRLAPRLRGVNAGDKLHKGAAILASRSADDLYRNMVSHWHDPASVVIGGAEHPSVLLGARPSLTGLDNKQRMMALDTLSYLPDDILTKVDRASMGVSLESRVPFLDHRVVEFAWTIPQSMKLRDGQSKWLLRQVLYRHVPRSLIERPKMGFGVPIDVWLRGPLRDWAEALLDESRLRREGYFHVAPIRQRWAEHLSGRRNWQGHLWDILMFQAWLEENRR
ncbi:asparagine synthase (glutamine-hydrolyzing) [Duganella sp. FT50W]|uniref:asparagine synthase (glutamine-hydrolyzing) n=1 Tax=Duganella lactea TaxID=2692173 RepID=A0A6L8MK24_9BURK|nr:asparagine synthase (glutamine-hydrolyzing) [Duganella lactea]MYM82949.1 asparagine synthase (glutamine-hydrolyzing) [Duganella lactea]